MTRIAITALASAWLLAGCLGSSSTREEDLVRQWVHVSDWYLRLDDSTARPGYFVIAFEEVAIIYRIENFAEEEEVFVLHLSKPLRLGDPDSGFRFPDREEAEDWAIGSVKGRIVNDVLSTFLELHVDVIEDRLRFQRGETATATAMLADQAVREYRRMEESRCGRCERTGFQ